MTFERAVANANLDAGRAPCHGLGSLFTSPYKDDHERAKPICGMCPLGQYATCADVLAQTLADHGDQVEGTWVGRLIKGKSRARATAGAA